MMYAEEDDSAAVKAAWLAERREEHARNFAQRQRFEGEAASSTAPEFPDDATIKREWLRQRQREHEQAMAQRERCAAATNAPAAGPLVDASLLSTPSDRELYLRAKQEERAHAQRERRRMSALAERRPSLPKDLESVPSHIDLAGAHLQLGCDPYASNCNYETTTVASSTTASGERLEADGFTDADGLETLEAFETLRIADHPYSPRRPSGSLSASSSATSVKASPRSSRPSSAYQRVPLVGPSPPVLPAAPRRRSMDAWGDDAVDSLPPSTFQPEEHVHAYESAGGAASFSGSGSASFGGRAPRMWGATSGTGGSWGCMMSGPPTGGTAEGSMGASPSSPSLRRLGSVSPDFLRGRVAELRDEELRERLRASRPTSPSAVLRLEDITVIKKR